MTWQFGSLRMFGYDVIEADPPTKFELYSEEGEEKSAAAHYELMEWEDLERFRINDLARDHSILLLWACAPTLPKSLKLMEAWGAVYKTELIWRKMSANGKPRTGPGYRARTMHEIVLLGCFGHKQIHKPFPSLFDGVRRQHSRKPQEFYDLVVDRTPGLTRCSLFTRETRAGFDSWGKEATKFDVVAA